MSDIVLMQEKRDCRIAAIGTACRVSYKHAAHATWHVDLVESMESPIFSNPWNLYRALLALGHWKRNLTLADLLAGNCESGKTIVLLHDPSDPVFSQHWVVWAGKNFDGDHRLLWGDSERARVVSPDRLKTLFLKGCRIALLKSIGRLFGALFTKKSNQ